MYINAFVRTYIYMHEYIYDYMRANVQTRIQNLRQRRCTHICISLYVCMHASRRHLLIQLYSITTEALYVGGVCCAIVWKPLNSREVKYLKLSDKLEARKFPPPYLSGARGSFPQPLRRKARNSSFTLEHGSEPFHPEGFIQL